MRGEIDLYDEKVQAGITWTLERLGKTLGLTTWVGGDGSETVEGDVSAEIHTILADAGLYDPEDGTFAKVQPQPSQQAEGVREEPSGNLPALSDIVDVIERTGQQTFYSMSLIRLVDGVSTYRLEIDGETLTFTDCEVNDWNAQAALYAHVRQVRLKVQATEVLTLFAPKGAK